MKKLIQILIFCELVIVMVGTASGEKLEIPNYYEFIKSIESDKYVVNGILDTLAFDILSTYNEPFRNKFDTRLVKISFLYFPM